MKKQTHEYISALMDEEFVTTEEQNQALDMLLHDNDACQKWHEYHIIRDCLQQSSPTMQHNIYTAEYKTNPQRQFTGSLPIWGGMAAAVALLSIALLFWHSDTPHTPPTLTQQNNHLDMSEPFITSNNKQEEIWLKAEQFYLSAHQQALNEQDMRQAQALINSY